MANHLEDLVAEWLEWNTYFVRKSVLVGPRSNGGYEGELDVVGFHPGTGHLVHIECSLDADKWEKREERFSGKFERGRRFIRPLFGDLNIDSEVDQVALLQFGGGERTHLGGARIVWVSDMISDILAQMRTLPPQSRAIPSTYPLLRTMQLAAQPEKKRKLPGSLIPIIVKSTALT